MIRILLLFMIWMMDDGSVQLEYARQLIKSKKYPQYGQINTRRLVHRALMYYLEHRRFTDFQINTIKRVLNG